ncbi:MAG: hypothetical protein MJ194_07000 [Clostridia bacterium]|nr:hypothetical protein [Clostridia bacterium]
MAKKDSIGKLLEKTSEIGEKLGQKAAALGETASIVAGEAKEKAKTTGQYVGERAAHIKDTAMILKEEAELKRTALDRELESAITNYNEAYTIFNDNGFNLYMQRMRAADVVDNVTSLINSIANHPKEFDSQFELIKSNKRVFKNNCDFAEKELKAARESAGQAGVGLAAGATVASLAPTAAMWIATTFGTASTGAAISTLSGAAATNAALAWLGGGALAAGGTGIAGGQALLALAGPIGWGIAGASLLTTIILFTKNKNKIASEKNEEITSIKNNTETILENSTLISGILNETVSLRGVLNEQFLKCIPLYGKNYPDLADEDKLVLGNMVNNTLSLSQLFYKTIAAAEEEADAE